MPRPIYSGSVNILGLYLCHTLMLISYNTAQVHYLVFCCDKLTLSREFHALS